MKVGAIDLKTIICGTASASSIATNFAGAPVCKKIYDSKTTGDLPVLTFITSFAAAACWFLYGISIADKATIYVNAIGAILQLGYAGVYYWYTMRKSTMIKIMGGTSLGILLTAVYVFLEPDPNRKKIIVGLIATIVTILTFSTPLFKLKAIMRERSTKSLPFPIIFMTFVTSSQWLIYGVLIKDPFMMVVNVIGSLLSIAQLSFFIIYRGEGGETAAASETPAAAAPGPSTEG